MPTGDGLTPFAPEHSEAVVGWVGSLGELEAWASRSDFPPDPAVFDAWHADPDVHAFVLMENVEFVAYGEIWADAAADEAELARMIVSPAHRGRGVGRRFVRMLAAEALRRGLAAVWLRVVPTNDAVIACYRRAGFRRAGAAEEQDFNRGQPRDYVWMTLTQGDSVDAVATVH